MLAFAFLRLNFFSSHHNKASPQESIDLRSSIKLNLDHTSSISIFTGISLNSEANQLFNENISSDHESSSKSSLIRKLNKFFCSNLIVILEFRVIQLKP